MQAILEHLRDLLQPLWGDQVAEIRNFRQNLNQQQTQRVAGNQLADADGSGIVEESGGESGSESGFQPCNLSADDDHVANDGGQRS